MSNSNVGTSLIGLPWMQIRAVLAVQAPIEEVSRS